MRWNNEGGHLGRYVIKGRRGRERGEGMAWRSVCAQFGKQAAALDALWTLIGMVMSRVPTG